MYYLSADPFLIKKSTVMIRRVSTMNVTIGINNISLSLNCEDFVISLLYKKCVLLKPSRSEEAIDEKVAFLLKLRNM
jgi:hypothetical protein